MLDRSSPHVVVTAAAGVTTIRIDRAAKRNALESAMYGALADALTAADRDPAIRVVVLTGGPDIFTAGADLSDFARPDASAGPLPFADFLAALTGLAKPLIAAVAGWAIGIGTTLLLHADLVYAAPTARFRTPFVELGLCPEAGSSLLLPALVGTRRAVEMLMLGAELDAAAAADAGLITAVVDDPIGHAHAVATTLAARAPGSLRVTKRLIRGATRGGLDAAIAAENAALAEQLGRGEAVEAVTARLARRAPDFSRFS
ncbi:MAG: enoyl-CoA hydratase/isomerase family protein [Kofleriaceae bacterium]|nr:enoyl-CoA hydratase/isomerase family protein [Kofleriaceae bacterium]